MTELDAYDLLDEAWAPRCDPPFPSEELLAPVENAYRYAKDAEPILAPEYEFSELPVDSASEVKKSPPRADPVTELNREYAFVVSGGSHHIIFETTDAKGRPKVEHLAEETFHRKRAAFTMYCGKKEEPVSRIWMCSRNRRSYDGFCFSPGRPADPRYYNLFRGFTVTPSEKPDNAPTEATEALAMFLEHSLQNICQGDVVLNKWLVGYFAHIFQRPWEKPGVALVFRGKKGVGKSALAERIGALLGSHFMQTAEKRYLVGNFNAHLESLIMLVLEEAFWSGQKDLEGLLKHLITGATHTIERKNKEAYTVDSCLRTIIIGNEKWLVPATEDERRYAVFDVGEERRQDAAFFDKMRLGMEAGGYSLLLRYLLDYDLSTVNVRMAPNTEGLLDQKTRSLNPIERWWFDCLFNGTIKGSTFIDGWPVSVTRQELRDAYGNYKRQLRITGWGETDVEFGQLIGQHLPAFKIARLNVDGKRARTYLFPSLEEARQIFDTKMNGKIKWEEE